jgi:hypothetical protein
VRTDFLDPRIDGQWKIIHTHWSYNMAELEQTEPPE